METHGQSRTKVYQVWASMHNRCRNPKSQVYCYYGGRGIKVDPRWDTFAQFAEDMGPRPDGTELDRVDPEGDYTAANCRWATKKVNQRNRRGARMVEVFGSPIKLADACEEFQIQYEVVHSRLARGWSVMNALFAPVKPGTSGAGRRVAQ